MIKCKIIAVDFDGTLCENKWPEIGAPNIELIKYLKRQKSGGDVKLILWTCRVNDKLDNAVNWCTEQGLSFDAINANIPEIIEEFGSDTRKVFAHEYIDDRMGEKFNFPFMKIETGITDEILEKIESIFEFRLYDWQKQYLKGYDILIPTGRSNGKTFTYCLRLLLGVGKPISILNYREINMLSDGPLTNRAYMFWFYWYLNDLNDKLVAYGLKTNVKYEEDIIMFKENGGNVNELGLR